MKKNTINGTVTVHVDMVEIEQIRITKPDLTIGFPETIHATVAAINQENMVTLNRQLRKFDHELEYLSALKDGDYYVVTFCIKRHKPYIEDIGNAS